MFEYAVDMYFKQLCALQVLTIKKTPSTCLTALSKHHVLVQTAFPAIDHVHPILELLQDPIESEAAMREGNGKGEVRTAVKRWYSVAMESKHTNTLLKSNL